MNSGDHRQLQASERRGGAKECQTQNRVLAQTERVCTSILSLRLVVPGKFCKFDHCVRSFMHLTFKKQEGRGVVVQQCVLRSRHRKQNEPAAETASSRDWEAPVGKILLSLSIPQIVTLCQQMIDRNLFANLRPVLLMSRPDTSERNVRA